MGNDYGFFTPIGDIPAVEQPQVGQHGVVIRITHRFWVPETLCKEGEEVFNINLCGPLGEVALPLSPRLRVTVDYLARYRHTAQTASQIAAGLNCHPFFKKHGANGGGGISPRRVTRAAVKQQMLRLRQVLSASFERVGIVAPTHAVLRAERTDSNSVLYRLRATVMWRHIEY